MGLQLSIVTPERPLVDAEVDSVVAPGREGEFGVLPGHQRFLAPLKPGVLRYTAVGQEECLVVFGGFVEVTQDSVTVLATGASAPSEVDAEASREALAVAEAALLELGSLAPPDQLEAAREKVEVERARLAVLG